MRLIPAADPLLSYYCPLPVDRSLNAVRLERFPRSAYEAVAGQIGPLANLRSSAGCAIVITTDSPRITVVLERLRHHQPIACGIALEIERDDGWHQVHSADVRELEGEVSIGLPTGLERGGPLRTVWIWLPLISTCVVAGIKVTEGAQMVTATVPDPQWLAIGDSLTQGFSVQSPVQNWVHRLSRRWSLPMWNMGVGGIKIEPAVFAPALARRYELVTIALGSNHSWRESDVDTAVPAAIKLAELALAGGHGRVVWLLPPWKPCEEGKGPPDFSGVPLDRAAGQRAGRVREALGECLNRYAPALTIIDDLMPHDHRLLPDGLHPQAFGFAKFADNVAKKLGG
jgi:GDSL-like Lipase/Acylhydrolase family